MSTDCVTCMLEEHVWLIPWGRVALAVLLCAPACAPDVATAPPVLARLEMSYTSRVVTVRQQLSLRVSAYESSNRRMETPPVQWTSDDPLIATVDPYGRVSGQGIGAAVIRASRGDVEARVEILVRPAHLRITLQSGSEDLLIGGKAVLSAEYLDAEGQPAPGGEPVRWSTFDSRVVRMDSAAGNPMQHEFTALTTGLARISTYAMGVEGRYVLAVVSPPESNPPVQATDFYIAQSWGIWDELILAPSLRVTVPPGRSIELVRVDVAVAMSGPYYPSLCSSARLLAGEHELLGAGSYPSTDDLSVRWYELPIIPRGVALLTYREGEVLRTVAVREPAEAAPHNVTGQAGLRWTPCPS